MSEVDLKLDWQEVEGERKKGDRFEASQVVEAEAEVSHLEPGVVEPPRRDSFEYSEHRARTLERALEKLHAVERPPFVSQLRRALAEGDMEALDSLEAWLSTQLVDWKGVGTVEAEEDYPEEAELAQLFNEAVSSGSEALGLGLEIISLVRRGDRTLAGRLLERVEELLNESREALEDLYAG